MSVFTKERPLFLHPPLIFKRPYGDHRLIVQHMDIDTKERKLEAQRIFKSWSRMDEFNFDIYAREAFDIPNPNIYMYRFLRQNISRAKSRGKKSWPNDLHPIDVYLLGEKQKWKCNLTGVRLEFDRGGEYWQNRWCNPESCVIDRIDSTKGYAIDNIQLVTHRANTWKSDFTHEELLWFSRKFVARSKRLVKS